MKITQSLYNSYDLVNRFDEKIRPLISKERFWSYLKEDLLKDSHWEELDIPGVGQVSRARLEELLALDYLVDPLELPYVKEVSSESLAQAQSEGWNTLHLAIITGSLDWVEVAIRQHSVNGKSREGKTPFNYACLRTSVLIIHLLLQYGADPWQYDGEENAPLVCAVRQGDVETVKLLISWRVFDKDNLALKIAIQNGHEGLIRILVESAFHIDLADDVDLPLIHLAIRMRNKTIVQFLIENGMSSSIRDCSGATIFHTAIGYGTLDIFNLLISQFVLDTTLKDNNDNTLLHWATARGDLTIVETLLQYGANVSAVNKDQVEPIFHTICTNQTKLVKLLVEKGANIHQTDKFGNSLVHLAAYRNLKFILLLLISNKANIFSENNFGMTPIMIAVDANNVDCVKLLERYGARDTRNRFPLIGPEIDDENKASGNTNLEAKIKLNDSNVTINPPSRVRLHPIHIESAEGNVDRVLELIQQGVSPDKINEEHKCTPLLYAVENNRQAVIKALIDAGASLNVKNKFFESPLHIAVADRNLELTTYLLQAKADINVKTDRSITPLHMAAHSGFLDLTRLLIQNQADPFIEDRNHRNPIRLAIEGNHFNVVKILFEHFKGLTIPHSMGKTILSYYCLKNEVEKVVTLLQLGADPNLTDNDGLNSLHHSAKNSSVELMQKLVEFNGDMTLREKTGGLPIHFAAARGNLPVFQYIIEQQPTQRDELDKNGTSVLSYAVIGGNQAIVDHLLAMGVNPNVINKLGNSAIHYAAQSNDLAIMKSLVVAGGNLRLRNKFGTAPIHHSSGRGHFEMSRLIVSICPDQVNRFNYFGETPLHLSSQYKQIELPKFLIEKGGLLFEEIERLIPPFLSISNKCDKLTNFYKEKFPKAVLHAQEVLYRKDLWHQIDTGEESTGTLYEGDILKDQIDYKGGIATYFRTQVIRNIREFSQYFPKIMSLEKARILKNAWSKKSNLDSSFNTEVPNFIITGFTGHTVLVLLWNNIFCICNRGLGSKTNVDFFRFNPKLLDSRVFNLIKSCRKKSLSNYLKVLYDILPKRLEFSKELLENQLTRNFSILKPQNRGTCAWTNIETAMGAYFVLETLAENNMDLNFVKNGIKRYEKWLSFMQAKSLQQYVNHSLTSSYRPDSRLIEKAVAVLRLQQINPKISVIINESIDQLTQIKKLQTQPEPTT